MNNILEDSLRQMYRQSSYSNDDGEEVFGDLLNAKGTLLVSSLLIVILKVILLKREMKEDKQQIEGQIINSLHITVLANQQCTSMIALNLNDIELLSELFCIYMEEKYYNPPLIEDFSFLSLKMISKYYNPPLIEDFSFLSLKMILVELWPESVVRLKLK
ncbi:hypothetical protein WN51_11910 [Melipona quadrifasciata]|uniref:Uncharacterized protein n=1 Tax=Melipona quadrifasciata TaxID=166423 RepID=A0A0M9A2W6_9HYME|nr:hypothetical protein WN51_11910 [Melipona quadrifasciata]